MSIATDAIQELIDSQVAWSGRQAVHGRSYDTCAGFEQGLYAALEAVQTAEKADLEARTAAWAAISRMGTGREWI